MPATTPDGLRYPLPGDNPNVPRDLGYLAEDVQAALLRHANLPGCRLEADSRVITTDGNGDLVIVFTQPFKAGTNPVVVTMPGDSPGVSGSDTHYLGIVTNTQFQLRGWRPGWTVRVNYIAVGEPA